MVGYRVHNAGSAMSTMVGNAHPHKVLFIFTLRLSPVYLGRPTIHKL